jgi:recombinational DNA repair protein (RecF pathway)
MREHIKYCPRCGTQELDFTTYPSDGHVLCIDCKTHFVVQSIRLDSDSGTHPSRTAESTRQ